MSDYVSCETEAHVQHDEVSALGFSANDLLPLVTGRYEIPIEWQDPCGGGDVCSSNSRCAEATDRVVPSVAGTSTVLTIDLEPTGAPAVVPMPGPEQTKCAQYMLIPARAEFSSTDGSIDAVVDVDLGSNCGDEIAFGLGGPASQLGGTLAPGLPEDAQVELTFGRFEDRIWFDLYLTPGPDSSLGLPYLVEGIIADEACPHDVPLGDVKID